MKSQRSENMRDWNMGPVKFFLHPEYVCACVCASVARPPTTFSCSGPQDCCTYANPPSGETRTTSFLLRQETERRTRREGARDRPETGIWNLLASSFERRARVRVTSRWLVVTQEQFARQTSTTEEGPAHSWH